MEKKNQIPAFLLLSILLCISYSPQLGLSELEPLPLTVELDIPGYLPNAEELRHPNKFFSGQNIRVRGKFTSLRQVQAEMVGIKTDTKRELNILKTTSDYIKLGIPPDILTDLYFIYLTLDGLKYKATVEINGFTSKKLKDLDGNSKAEKEEALLSPAVLYHSHVNCGPDIGQAFQACYWESVLTGHPTDPNHLVIAGIGSKGPDIHVSHDGGLTWSPGNTEGEPYCCMDPKSLVTPEGSLLLSSLTYLRQPDNPDNLAALGALFQGPVTGNSLTGSYFKDIPDPFPDESVPNIVDFPKIAYDPKTGTIFIFARVVFNDASSGKALFVSHDSGQSFSEQKIDFPHGYNGPITSMDVTPEGHLRAVVRTNSRRLSRYFLLRFGEDDESFDISTSFLFPGWEWIARVSAESERSWITYTGPEIVIDKSNRNPGRMYMLWAFPESSITDDPNFQGSYYGKNFDIFFSYSDDDGETWTEPQKVNDDNSEADQVFPSIYIDRTGVVHVVFLDTRESRKLEQYDVYYARIVDGIVSKNIRVNPTHVPNLGGRHPGDYLDMVVGYPDKAYVSYPCVGWSSFSPQDACITALDPNLVPFPGEFIRGDSNGDFRIDISDAIHILGWLFLGDEGPDCLDSADSNDDGVIDISDASFLLSFLFLGGPKPNVPFPDFGKDLSQDNLKDC